MSDSRPDPDLLLAQVQAEDSVHVRGKLKIFFGAAPGVGKTYAMLEAGRKLAKEGIDVVVGYVEPHARPDTLALVLGLEILPRREVRYRGHTLYDFDLTTALARKPQLLLLDELAHTNAEGSLYAKRWQDVEALLAAGINVYTTLNVQHLESLNDVVAQITTIPVRETVPDQVFEQADEVELVDIAPDDLIERLHEGKVYLPEQARRAIENFFRKGNLIALRELSLRKTAERVGSQAVDWRQTHDVSKIWPTSERLLVCVGSSPMSARLIRATRRMAVGLRAPWIGLHAELTGEKMLNMEDRARLETHLRLVEELGGTIANLTGETFSETVLRYCREHNITKIIVGKPLMNWWQEWLRGAYVYDLIRKSGDIDVYVISGDSAAPEHKSSHVPTAKSWWPYIWSSLAVAVCTLLCFALFQLLAATNLAMIYLACVVSISLAFGRWPSVLSAILSVAAFDLFFVEPYGSFAVSDTQYLFTFAVMLITGLVVSELVSRVHAQTELMRRREQRTSALYDLSREISSLPTRESVAQAAQRIIGLALDADVNIFVTDKNGNLQNAVTQNNIAQLGNDAGVVKWVWEHHQAAGLGTDTLPGGEATYLPLLTPGGVVGVMGVKPLASGRKLEIAQLHMLEAFSAQVAGALERCSLALHAEQARLQIETERLRNSLLSAVSHDLRTPLATITGAASLLVEESGNIESCARHDLAESIVEEADRLHRLVANLLDLTRLEAGAIQLKRELQPIEEVIGVVIQRFERQLRGHVLQAHLPQNLPPVPIDGLLLQQVLMNLLDNAVKFSPETTPIDLYVKQTEHDLILEISDRGLGLPAGEELKVFEKFYRVEGHQQAGSGIGLAICRGIVELHGGTIEAENRDGGGATFRIQLPLKYADSSFVQT